MNITSMTRDDVLRTLESLSWTQIALGSVSSYVAYSVAAFVYDYWNKSRSPLRDLPAPKERAGWIFGHIPVLFGAENNKAQERWVDELGETYATRGMFGKYQLITTDTRANTHILFASNMYPKPEMSRRATKRFFGESVLITEGEQHRDQRRLLNPAFGFSRVRDMTQIFLEKAAQLREVWYSKCSEAGGSVTLDALDWVSKAALDALGKAAFDYDFGMLNETGETNELAEAFEQVLRSDVTLLQQMRLLLNGRFPLLRAIAPGLQTKMMDNSKATMDRIGMQIVQERKAAILAELGGGANTIERKAVGGKDLISLLLQANMAADVDPAQRLSDEDVLAQIPTFLVGGHETTSNSIVWAMYALAQNLAAQKRLRDELLAVPTDTPTLDALNALPYLDQVLREVLRLHTVVMFVEREACANDAIPLGKPTVDRHGKTITHIKIQKGDQIMVPIWLINRSKSIWGPDADKFRPERWDSPPSEAAGIPGIAPNLMSFIGGPHSCIGYRFAIAEMKAMLFHIVRGFEFKLAVDPSEVWSRTGLMMRPQLRGTNSVELPVVLTPVA